jgi:hypothetical protein
MHACDFFGNVQLWINGPDSVSRTADRTHPLQAWRPVNFLCAGTWCSVPWHTLIKLHHVNKKHITRYTFRSSWLTLLTQHEEHRIFLFFTGSTSTFCPGLCFCSFTIILQTVGLLGRVISSSQGLYLNAGQHKHRINTYTHQTSMPCVGFDPMVPAS